MEMIEKTTKTRDPSAVGERTRRAILDAGAFELARNPNATIAQVAKGAQMSRSTVHRHFAERADLVNALRLRADEEVHAAYAQAAFANDTARAQLLRLAHAFFERADLLMAAYVTLAQVDRLAIRDAADPNMRMLVERGEAEGSIDPKLHPAWVEQALWGLLYASWLTTANGSISRLDALNVLLDALDKLLTPNR